MSNRTLIELNHDFCPRDEDLLRWAKCMAGYMRSGDQKYLPDGATWKNMRHHSQPCPLEPSATPQVQDAILQEFCRLARLSISGKAAGIFRNFLREHLNRAPLSGTEEG